MHAIVVAVHRRLRKPKIRDLDNHRSILALVQKAVAGRQVAVDKLGACEKGHAGADIPGELQQELLLAEVQAQEIFQVAFGHELHDKVAGEPANTCGWEGGQMSQVVIRTPWQLCDEGIHAVSRAYDILEALGLHTTGYAWEGGRGGKGRREEWERRERGEEGRR